MSILDAAQELAKAHRQRDPETRAVFLYSGDGDDEIRLLEVSASAPTTNEVLPFRFDARPELGVPYRSVVVIVSPEEWAAIEQGHLPLPHGWANARPLP